MSKHKPGVDSRVGHHFLHAVHQELDALLSFLRFHWGLALLLVVGLLALLLIINPFPPSRVTLATGQVNTTFDVLGKKYVEYFRQHGVTLELRTTTGTFENIELLKDGKVDAVFSLGGVKFDSDDEHIVSLGSVLYMPMWLFYRGEPFEGVDPTEFFKSKQLSVNIVGSGTFDIAQKLLQLHGVELEQHKNLQIMTSKDTLDAASKGQLDGAFLLGTTDSKTISTLMVTPGVNTFDFKLADAYVKYLPYLRVLDIPRGAIDLKTMTPSHDVKMVATTATLLTTDKMHPAIENMFLAAANEHSLSDTAPLSAPGTFPAHVDRSQRLSETAQRYYLNGLPVLTGRVPFWLASFFDRIWFFVLAGLTILIPLTRLTPNYRSVYAKLCMTDTYIALDGINERLSAAKTLSDLVPVLTMLTELRENLHRLWIPNSIKHEYYLLENSLEIVHAKSMRLHNTLAGP